MVRTYFLVFFLNLIGIINYENYVWSIQIVSCDGATPCIDGNIGSLPDQQNPTGSTRFLRLSTNFILTPSILANITSLKNPLQHVITVHDEKFHDNFLLRQISQPKTLVMAANYSEKLVSAWNTSRPSVIIYFNSNAKPLLKLAAGDAKTWAFRAWHILIDWHRQDFEKLSDLPNLRRTAMLLNIIQNGKSGWRILRYYPYAPANQRLRATSQTEFKDMYHPLPGKCGGVVTVMGECGVVQEKNVNLQGAQLTAVTFEWKPSVMYVKDKNGKMLSAYGIDIEVLNALAQTLNFTFKYQEPPPGELWGTPDSNGTWAGMVGMLNRGLGDMGIGNLFLTVVRKDVITYSAPYDAEVSCFLAASVTPLPRWQSPAFPFTKWTWLAILLGMLVVTTALALFGANVEREGTPERKSMEKIFMISFSILMKMNIPWDPRADPTRFVLTGLLFFSFIVTSAYCSNLTALLTVSKVPRAFESIAELYHTGLSVVSLGDFFKGSLASADDPYLKGLADRFIPYDSLDDIFRLVSDRKVVYLHNRQFLEYSIATKTSSQKNSPGYRMLKQCFAPYNIAMALQRHSPLKPYVDDVIGRLLQSGLIRHWFLESLRLSRSSAETAHDGDTNSTEQRPDLGKASAASADSGMVLLSMEHLSGPFLGLALLHALALVIFVCELCIRQCRIVTPNTLARPK